MACVIKRQIAIISEDVSETDKIKDDGGDNEENYNHHDASNNQETNKKIIAYLHKNNKKRMSKRNNKTKVLEEAKEIQWENATTNPQ